jgi:hypothetical protein
MAVDPDLRAEMNELKRKILQARLSGLSQRHREKANVTLAFAALEVPAFAGQTPSALRMNAPLRVPTNMRTWLIVAPVLSLPDSTYALSRR